LLAPYNEAAAPDFADAAISLLPFPTSLDRTRSPPVISASWLHSLRISCPNGSDAPGRCLC